MPENGRTVSESELAAFGGGKAVPIDPPFKWPVITEEEISDVVELLRKGKISIAFGDVIADFEKDFAEYHGIKYALLQNNGTSTLHAAFWAVGVEPGDEVIVPTYTWLASATPIIAVGGIPVFCDVDPRTFCADPTDIERRITDKTKAICVVHIWGHPVDMDPIMKIAGKYDLKVIEDCSHAHGSLYKGKKVGTIGDIGCFSLQGSKAMTGGEAGVLITDDRELYERAMLVGQYRRTLEEITIEKYKPYAFTALGWKYRAHPVAAILARHQLRKLDDRNRERRKAHEYFIKGISEIEGVIPPYTAPYAERGGWYGLRVMIDRSVIKTGKKLPDDLPTFPEYMPELPRETAAAVKLLSEEGVKVTPERYRLLHLQPFFTDEINIYSKRKNPYRWKEGDFPVSENIVKNMLALNRFDVFDKEYIDMNIEAFRKVFSYLRE